MVAQLNKKYIGFRLSKAITRLLSYGLFEGRPLTTKGRWINPVVFGLYSLFKFLPPLKKVKKPVFILGTGRSGTTLLGLLLSMHKDIGYLNEPKALWNSVYPFEDLIGSYSEGTAHYNLDRDDATPEIRKKIQKCFGGYLWTVCASRVVDKYPELVFRVDFVKALFPDAKFVFIVRGGHDTCKSIEKWSQRKGVVEGKRVHDWWGVDNRKWRLLVDQVLTKDQELSKYHDRISMYRDHTQMALVEWILAMNRGAEVLDKKSNDVYLIRYEDLTFSPEGELVKLADFLELEFDPVMIAHAKEVVKPTVHHGRVEIPTELKEAFEKVMKRFGYCE